MGEILLTDVRIYAYHGCLAEESLVGSDYRVDLKVKSDIAASMQTDKLSDTVDYVQLNRIIKEEMTKRSELLEHVAGRISDRIFSEIPKVEQLTLSISKINPPIGGDVASVSVKIKRKRFAK
ncbi:MAG: dihydroneopterin aldolase [Capnocytophaga sp.]|nr:dihydroneopterin aldolase [Capnocytophaga sp.]